MNRQYHHTIFFFDLISSMNEYDMHFNYYIRFDIFCFHLATANLIRAMWKKKTKFEWKYASTHRRANSEHMNIHCPDILVQRRNWMKKMLLNSFECHRN